MNEVQTQQIQTWFRTGRVGDKKISNIDTAANLIGVSIGDMRQQHLIDDLARDFSREIESWIGVGELQKVNELNNAPDADPQCCASHDFCDPNQAMINILERRNIDCLENIELCNAIWDTARRNNFYLKTPIAES